MQEQKSISVTPGRQFFKMKTLEFMLEEISREPYSEKQSKTEEVFLRLVRELEHINYITYATFIMKYNDVINSKIRL